MYAYSNRKTTINYRKSPIIETIRVEQLKSIETFKVWVDVEFKSSTIGDVFRC